MKYIIKSALYFSAAILISGILPACQPDEFGKDGMGTPLPTGQFSVTPVAGKVNTYLVNSSDEDGFVFKWDMGEGSGVITGNKTDTAYFPEAGNYTIKLTVFNRGGYATGEQKVTVATADPNSCYGVKAALTGCGTKTWKLLQDAGALWVGPNDNSATWWSNGANDVRHAERVCMFNDEYTFSADGSFVFDNKGDFRVDDEGDAAWPRDIGLPIGCYSNSQMPEKYKAWTSGNFTFKVIGNKKIQVIGTGAHMGSYKLGDASATLNEPAASVTYDVVSYSDTRLVIRKQYDWGGWRYTFAPKP